MRGREGAEASQETIVQETPIIPEEKTTSFERKKESKSYKEHHTLPQPSETGGDL